ncbi:MAG: hypothetical protein QOI61_1230, partial [Actinomycetota bacterium]
MRRIVLAVVLCLTLPAGARAANVARFVDPTIGTFGTGWVFPGADVPFGMVQNSPDTLGPLVYAGYMGNDALIRGFSLVHYSGVGVADGGDLPFMPWIGNGLPPSDPMKYAAPFTHANESAKAGYYSVLLGNGVKAELTATAHSALQRYAFPPAGDAYLIVDPRHNNAGAGDAPNISANEGEWTRTGDREITGSTFNGRYRVFFVARFDKPIAEAGEHWLKFAPGETVTMRAGISFVDSDGARNNLDKEEATFDDARARAFASWNKELNRIKVSGGTIADKRTFYTALYHALLHPNVFEDVDGRYRGFDDVIRPSDGRTVYANFSSWDTYKAQNQLLATLYPRRYADMLRSQLTAAQQQGHLPRWAEQNSDPGYMTGDPAVPMIADGVCRGIVKGDEAQALYAEAVALQARREPGLLPKGYLTLAEARYAVATTLEYGVADFALALMQHQSEGQADERSVLGSVRYRNLLDQSTQWIRPRLADGSWLQEFIPENGYGFQEGTSWQYSWLAMQDLRGVIDRMGGNAAVQDRLDKFFNLPASAAAPVVWPKVQNQTTVFGIDYHGNQYAPGNEHDLEAPYVYNYAGAPWKTQAATRGALSIYTPTPDGLPGNDDLGALSGWVVWSMLGIYPITPGAPLYTIASPVFDHAVIHMASGDVTIDAPNHTFATKYVQSVNINVVPLHKTWLSKIALD